MEILKDLPKWYEVRGAKRLTRTLVDPQWQEAAGGGAYYVGDLGNAGQMSGLGGLSYTVSTAGMPSTSFTAAQALKG